MGGPDPRPGLVGVRGCHRRRQEGRIVWRQPGPAQGCPFGKRAWRGPGAAEITFDETTEERPTEPFLVFTADKCGPGPFNFPLWTAFTSPLFCAGLMLPSMEPGFRFTVIDMEHAGDIVLPPEPPPLERRVGNLERWAGELDPWARTQGYDGVEPGG